MFKRYLLFILDEYNPGGGWHDFQCDYDTLDDAIAGVLRYANDGCYGYPQIIDGYSGEDVAPDWLFNESSKTGKEVQKARKESPLRFDAMNSADLWQEYEGMFGNSPLIGDMPKKEARPLIIQALKSGKPIIPGER